MSLNNRLIDFLDKPESKGYLYGDSSNAGTRHESWMKATCLSNLAISEKLDKIIELLSKEETKEKTKK